MLAVPSDVSSPGLVQQGALPEALAIAPRRGDFDAQRDFLDHLANDRLETLAATLAPDCLLLLPGMRPVTGAALVERVLRSVRHRYETLRFETILQFRSPDDMFVVNSKVHGRRSDGTSYDNDAITLIRLDQSGRIALITDYYKDTSYSEGADRPQPRHA